MSEETKFICLSCGEEKREDEFRDDKNRKNGKYVYCRSCEKIGHSYGIGVKIVKEKKRLEYLAALPSTKVCCRCNIEKQRDCFNKSKSRRDGRHPVCKSCCREAERKLSARRKEERKKSQPIIPKDHKICSKCKNILPFEDFYTNSYNSSGRQSRCRLCIKTESKNRYKNDPKYKEKLIQRRRDSYKKEKLEGRNCKADWIKRNPDKNREIIKRRNIKRVSTPSGRLEARVLSLIKRSVLYRIGQKGIPTKWEKYLGYTFDDLVNHIESQFTDGMNWEKLKNGEIDIDHIVPRSAFYYETIEDEDFKKCWGLSNLQPLWSVENREKGDKMPDGSSGRKIGAEKKRLLDEEFSVPGFEITKRSFEEECLSG